MPVDVEGIICSKLCGGGSVTVWAGIHHGVRIALVYVAGVLMGIIYQDEILQYHVNPYMNMNDGMF